MEVVPIGESNPHRVQPLYLCGPVPMRDAFLGQLKKLGVPRRQIFYEEFSLR